jgi:hypothetical protein
MESDRTCGVALKKPSKKEQQNATKAIFLKKYLQSIAILKILSTLAFENTN